MSPDLSQISVRKFAKLAAVGAIGVSFGVLALYALIAFGSSHAEGSGIDRTQATVAYIAAAIPAVAIIAAHLAYVKVLLDESKKNV